MSLNLEALKERNQSNTAQALKPYQPLEYAVPQELGSDIAAAPRKRDASAGYSYVGDVDANGAIDLFDIVAVRDHIFGVETLTGNAAWAADVDNNGAIDLFDIVAIRDHIFGIELIPPEGFFS